MLKTINTMLLWAFNQKKKTLVSAEEKWLAQSADLVDLEQRQKRLQYGTSPFHVNANRTYRGWV